MDPKTSELPDNRNPSKSMSIHAKVPAAMNITIPGKNVVSMIEPGNGRWAPKRPALNTLTKGRAGVVEDKKKGLP